MAQTTLHGAPSWIRDGGATHHNIDKRLANTETPEDADAKARQGLALLRKIAHEREPRLGKHQRDLLRSAVDAIVKLDGRSYGLLVGWADLLFGLHLASEDQDLADVFADDIRWTFTTWGRHYGLALHFQEYLEGRWRIGIQPEKVNTGVRLAARRAFGDNETAWVLYYTLIGDGGDPHTALAGGTA